MLALACAGGCIEAKPYEAPPAAESDAGADAPVCTPACADRLCGDDGCGGTCGSCPDEQPFCIEGGCTADCQPSCEEKECGDDGCGGTCGACPGAAPYCESGLCSATCTPDCDNKECGDDGCGETCGQCPAVAPKCSESFKCQAADCDPDCEGRACGGDGCGGSCGECKDDDLSCNGEPQCDEESGSCIAQNIPVCDDENPCTVNTCVEGSPGSPHECESNPDEEAACDDGDPCTQEDVCAAGACTGAPLDCNENDPCIIGALCDSESGECAGGEEKVCGPGQWCLSETGLCVYAEESECYDQNGDVTTNVTEQVECLLFSDSDSAMGLTITSGSDDDFVPATDGGDEETMEAGVQVTVNPADGAMESLMNAYSFMSFDSAWGISQPKKPQHAIYGELVLREGAGTPTFSADQLEMFTVFLLSDFIPEDTDQTIIEALESVGVELIIEGPPVVEESLDGGPKTWTFNLRFEPDQVTSAVYKTLGIGMFEGEDEEEYFAAIMEFPGFAKFQTKEGEHSPILILDYTECAPSCDNRTCGSDGCDGDCGACDGANICVEQERSSFCCAESPCPPEATCGTSICGSACDPEAEDIGYPCFEGTLSETGWGYDCAGGGCDVHADLDIEAHPGSKFWVDEEPIITLFESSGFPSSDRVALAQFKDLEPAIASYGASAVNKELHLKLWFAQGEDASETFVALTIPKPWQTNDSIDEDAIKNVYSEGAWLNYTAPSDISEDGAYIYPLGLNIDSGDDLLTKLYSGGLLITTYSEYGIQLLRASESGFGPVLFWKGADCSQACDGKQCGPDGCGGTCGSCSNGDLCDTLEEGTGTYQCLPEICDEDETSCADGNAVSCSSLGTGFYETDLCAQDQLACVQQGGASVCGQGEPLSSWALQLTAKDGETAFLMAPVPELHGTTAEQTNDPMTLSLWVRFPKDMTNGTIASFEASGVSKVIPPDSNNAQCPYGDFGWALYLEDERLKFKTTDLMNQTARVAMTEPVMAAYASTWVHLAVVSRGVEGDAAHANGNVQLYVNGADRWAQDELVLSEQETSGLYVGMSPLAKAVDPSMSIGRHRCESPGSGNPFGQLKIAVDEISAFGSALSHSQITRLFAGGCGEAPTILADKEPLYAWWRMGEGFDNLDALKEAIEEGQAVFMSASDQITEDTPVAILAGDLVSATTQADCAAPASCEDFEGATGEVFLQGCGPGCAVCAEGQCSSMGWCESANCSVTQAEPVEGEGCSDACGSAPSVCDGQQKFCGYAGGVGSCHHDTANAVAAYSEIGFVVVGTSCSSGTTDCDVALWRYSQAGELVDKATFTDLATQAFGFDAEENLEEEGLGVDVALDGSYGIVIVGRTRVQDGAVNGEPQWRPMIASINGADLSVDWVWVDKDYRGAFTDVSLVAEDVTSNQEAQVEAWKSAIAVGYHSQHYWTDGDEVVWKRGRMRRSIVTVEGVPLPDGGAWDWPEAPPNVNAPNIPIGGSYTSIDRAPDGSQYLVYNIENSNYAGLDATLERISPPNGTCITCWGTATAPYTSPVTSHEYLAVSAVSGASWPDDANRAYVAVKSTVNANPSEVATRVLRYRDGNDGWGLMLEETIDIESPLGGPANIEDLCAMGASGFFLTGSMATPSGVIRPWVERRAVFGNSGGPTWRQYYGYESLDGADHNAPSTTPDSIHGCVLSGTKPDGLLVTVGEILQPNAMLPGDPRDAYITTRNLETGKSACR